MRWIQSMVIAFSMYSKVPMPQIEWNQENMKYVMIFFPWVGAFIGFLALLLDGFLTVMPFGKLVRGILFTVLPILITGGIHMDGFMDTQDAIHSYKSQEEKLRILKDPNTGAFAVISSMIYFLLSVAVFSELNKEGIEIISIGYFLTRCLSGLSVATFPCCKKSGLAATFSSMAERKTTKLFLSIFIIAAAFLLAFYHQLMGISALVAAILVFVFYGKMSRSVFGGINGDLAGWFLQMAELAMAIIVLIMQSIHI